MNFKKTSYEGNNVITIRTGLGLVIIVNECRTVWIRLKLSFNASGNINSLWISCYLIPNLEML